MTLRRRRPALVVDLGRIADLRSVDVTPDSVRLGALVTAADIARHATLAETVACCRTRPRSWPTR